MLLNLSGSAVHWYRIEGGVSDPTHEWRIYCSTFHFASSILTEQHSKVNKILCCVYRDSNRTRLMRSWLLQLVFSLARSIDDNIRAISLEETCSLNIPLSMLSYSVWILFGHTVSMILMEEPKSCVFFQTLLPENDGLSTTQQLPKMTSQLQSIRNILNINIA